MKKNRLSRIFRKTSYIILFIYTLLFFIFALLSGADSFGGGFQGIVYNSPNALPWLFLFIFDLFAWKYQLIGSLFILLFSLFTIFFFKTFQDPVVFAIVSLPLLIISLSLLLSYHLSRTAKKAS